MTAVMRFRWNLSSFLPAKARSYLWLLPVCAVAGGGIALYRSSDRPSTYQCSGRLVMSGRLNFSEGNPVANDFMNVLGTQLEILTSEELRERAMIKLKLERPEAAVRPDLAARMVPRTTIFELTATSGAPTHVQRYLDLVMEEYIAMRREQRLVSSRSVMDQISGEIARLEKILNEQEAELFRFKQQRNIVFWEQQATTAARFLSQLKNREASLRMQLKLAELLDRGADKEALAQRAGSLEISDSAGGRARVAGSAPAGSAALAAQKVRVRELEIERDALARIYLPKHPKYRKVDEELAKLRRLVGLLEQEEVGAFKSEVDGMRSELQTILNSMDEWEKKVLESSQIEAEHQKLQGSVSRTRELYQRLVGSLQNIDFRKGVDDEVIQILKRAGGTSENKPDYTGPVRNGVILGLLGAIGLTALAVRMDRRAFAVAEVSEGLGAEVGVEIPLIRRRLKSQVALADPACPGAFAEAIRSLRSALAMEHQREGPGGMVFVVCSSTPGEGKSTIALNLAHASASAGLKTLLIDADLRRGTVGHRLGLPPDHPGLADYLRSEGDWRHFVRPAAGFGFAVMTCGANSSALVDQLMFKLPAALTVETKAEYEVVVIDSAPIIPVSDTIPFISRVDRVIFVVRLRNALITTSAKALQVLKRSARRELLVVVNGTRPSDGHDYYDYSAYRYYGGRRS
ncbi:MAG: GumC family protein [Opitutaceae bacterium]